MNFAAIFVLAFGLFYSGKVCICLFNNFKSVKGRIYESKGYESFGNEKEDNG